MLFFSKRSGKNKKRCSSGSLRKHATAGLLLFFSGSVFGQYTRDDSIKKHPFLKTVVFQSDLCGLRDKYYEQKDFYGINGSSMACYLLQEQLKDSLKARFRPEELVEIAMYSKIPFYRLAAFELYTQTSYSKDKVIRFLKRGKIPSPDMYSDGLSDSIPEMYIPVPNSLQPAQAAIRLKMLSMLDPGAKRRTRKDTLNRFVVTEVARYPKSKALSLEDFVSLKAYLLYHCSESIATTKAVSILKPGEKARIPTFNLPVALLDFGTVDLAYADPANTYFELRGTIQVVNTSSAVITITGQASAHTICTPSQAVIPPKQKIMIEFKSLVELHKPYIDRSITLTNTKTGEAQVFKFKAACVNLKQH